jgi:hypothetical protein
MTTPKPAALEWRTLPARTFWRGMTLAGRYTIYHMEGRDYDKRDDDRGFLLEFDPAGLDRRLGLYRSLDDAKAAAERHARSKAATAERCKASVHVMGTCGRIRPCLDHDKARCDGLPGRPCGRVGVVSEVIDRGGPVVLAWVIPHGQWRKRRHRKLCRSCEMDRRRG